MTSDISGTSIAIVNGTVVAIASGSSAAANTGAGGGGGGEQDQLLVEMVARAIYM